MTTKAIAAREAIRGGREHLPEEVTGGGPAVYAAGLSLTSALIHLWAAPEHLEEWWAYGAFFLICAVCQGLFSILIVRWPWSPAILLAAIAGNLTIVATYVVSRTWGVPLGPDWVLFSPDVAHMEDAGALGMLATATEFGVVCVCVASLDGARRKTVVNVLLVLGVAVWTLRLTGILP